MANSGRCKHCNFLPEDTAVHGDGPLHHKFEPEPISGEATQVCACGDSGCTGHLGGASTGEQPPRRSCMNHNEYSEACDDCWRETNMAARPVSGTEPAVPECDCGAGPHLKSRSLGMGLDAAGGTEESAGPRIEAWPTIFAVRGLHGSNGAYFNRAAAERFIAERTEPHKYRIVEYIPKEAAAPSLAPRPRCPKCGSTKVVIEFGWLHLQASICRDCKHEDYPAQFFSAQEAGQ